MPNSESVWRWFHDGEPRPDGTTAFYRPNNDEEEVQFILMTLAARDELVPTSEDVCGCWPYLDHTQPDCLFHLAWTVLTRHMTDTEALDFRVALHRWRDHGGLMPLLGPED